MVQSPIQPKIQDNKKRIGGGDLWRHGRGTGWTKFENRRVGNIGGLHKICEDMIIYEAKMYF